MSFTAFIRHISAKCIFIIYLIIVFRIAWNGFEFYFKRALVVCS